MKPKIVCLFLSYPLVFLLLFHPVSAQATDLNKLSLQVEMYPETNNTLMRGEPYFITVTVTNNGISFPYIDPEEPEIVYMNEGSIELKITYGARSENGSSAQWRRIDTYWDSRDLQFLPMANFSRTVIFSHIIDGENLSSQLFPSETMEIDFDVYGFANFYNTTQQSSGDGGIVFWLIYREQFDWEHFEGFSVTSPIPVIELERYELLREQFNELELQYEELQAQYEAQNQSYLQLEEQYAALNRSYDNFLMEQSILENQLSALQNEVSYLKGLIFGSLIVIVILSSAFVIYIKKYRASTVFVS